MRTTIKIALIAALAATADVSVAQAAGPATPLASSAAVLEPDSRVEQVQRRVVRRGPIVRGGSRRVVRPYNRGGQRWARGTAGYGHRYSHGNGGYWNGGYGNRGYWNDGYWNHGYGNAGAAAAAGIIGLALGATLGAAANDRYYGEPGVYDAPPASSQALVGCYRGAGDRLECPRY
jgi:hypothetical protein